MKTKLIFGLTRLVIPLALLLALASLKPMSAGVIVLEGTDANGVHCFEVGEQAYANQLLAGLKGSSTLPVLILKTAATPACSITTSPVPHVFTTSLAAASPAFSPANYSALYIMSPGGCCSDGRSLVSAADQAAIAAFVAAGRSLGIQDFQGGDWGAALGFTAPPADVGGFGPPLATAGGSVCFDGNTPTAAGVAFGFTSIPVLGCFGHQAYNMSYFGPLGFTALVVPSVGFPPGFATVIAKLCPRPVISGVSADPSVLWPPNHKFVPVTIAYTLTSPCGGTCTLSVSSNEAVNAPGSGNTDPDWIVVDAAHVLLRAERAGPGDGRVYTITITCTSTGGTTTKSIEVTVPHDQGN
jgi:hypothetical protein